jgi:DNA polymerase-1
LYPLGEAGTSREHERVKKHWRNVAINTPVQNVANCFALASLAHAVWWTLDERPEVKVVMTVHDSILLEVPDALVQEAAERVKAIMLSWPSGIVPLKVDVEVGPDWGHMKKLEIP